MGGVFFLSAILCVIAVEGYFCLQTLKQIVTSQCASHSALTADLVNLCNFLTQETRKTSDTVQQIVASHLPPVPRVVPCSICGKAVHEYAVISGFPVCPVCQRKREEAKSA